MYEILWELPAAIAYQLKAIHYQMQGGTLSIDDRSNVKIKLREARLTHG